MDSIHIKLENSEVDYLIRVAFQIIIGAILFFVFSGTLKNYMKENENFEATSLIQNDRIQNIDFFFTYGKSKRIVL